MQQNSKHFIKTYIRKKHRHQMQNCSSHEEEGNGKVVWEIKGENKSRERLGMHQ